ncbi:MAG: hypothetical protein QM817_23045 [Archangium sp.]
MSPKISNQPAVVQPKVTQGTKAAAPKKLEPTPVEVKKPAVDTSFADAAKKKGPNMTGRHKPVAKAPVPVKKDLSADVAKLRSAVQAGSVSKQKVDPEVKGALDRIKLVAYKGKDAIGDVLKDLEPSVAKEVFKNLPASAKAEIGMNTPYGFQPTSVRMAQVQNMTDDQLSQVAEAMRGGGVEDLGLQLAVTTELAARTQWGKDNPEIVDYQRQLVVDGKVNFSDGRGAARTETSGEVTMNPSLSKSPEALAALLAHEATHSYHAANGGMDKSTYKEETAGNMASAQVWAELGKEDFNLTQNQRDSLNDYAKLYKAGGEDAVQSRVAAEYASEASKAASEHAAAAAKLDKAGDTKGAKAERRAASYEEAKVKDVANELSNDPGAVKQMNGTFAFEVTRALLGSRPDQADVEKLGATLKNLSPSAKKELLEQLKNLPPEAKEAKDVFLKALG